MRRATTKWLLALTLALTLAAPEFITRGDRVARGGEFAPPPVQIIRKVTVSSAYPMAQKARSEKPQPQPAKNQIKSKPEANRSVKHPPGKSRSQPQRAIPIRPKPLRTTAVLTPAVPANTGRTKPARSVCIPLKVKRASNRK